MTGLSKTDAIRAMHELGYKELFMTGYAGDGPHGSRLYFKSPDAPLNEFGMPMDLHGTISRHGSLWYVSDFGRRPD